jgi:hypothetical protein
VVEWLIGVPSIYDKEDRQHKNGAVVARLWAEKAEELNMESAMLKTWYKSCHSQYSKVMREEQQRESGKKVKDITTRDKWILAKFAFLKSHIKAKPDFCQGSNLKKGDKVEASEDEEE